MQNYIITIAVVGVIISAVLAAFGFRGRVTTIGVDLGTTFSVVCININGREVVVEDSSKRRLFPSIVSFTADGGFLVAHNALPYLSISPENTIFNAKRFLGRSLDDESMAIYSKAHPFSVVKSNVSQFGSVGFALNVSGHPPVVAPEDVGIQVIKYLLSVTAQFLGHSQVNKAVIAVPAKFSSLQRQATGHIYKSAGLKVVRVLEEPTAAAVAYDLHKKPNVHHILVYDFGGGTLDVSLLYVAKGSVQVYATDGDESLGGSDLDLCMYDLLRERAEAQSGEALKLHSLSEMEKGVHQGDICVAANVRAMAEQLKKDLSNDTSVQFSCRLPDSTPAGQKAESSHVNFTVTREDFETSCKDLFDRAMTPVDRLIHDLGMQRSDVDEIVLVGGTTRVPKVKQQLREYFGKNLNDEIDPDITVAVGAAAVLD